MILLVASNKDIASLNIKKQILNHYAFTVTFEEFQENPIYQTSVNSKTIRFVTLNDESVRAQNLPEHFSNLELIIFVSRHSSLSGKPTLSVHTPGNLDEAGLGGIARTVSVSPANAMRDALKEMMRLKKKMQLDYEVCYEGTHHGPSLNVPAMFTELGSSPAQWNDMEAAEVVAHAAMKAAQNFGVSSATAVLGIGGPHYNSKFTKLALEEQLAFGHMIPKYAMLTLTIDVLRQCVERTMEKTEQAVLDWKGIRGEHKQPLIKMLDEAGMKTKKV